MLESVDLLYIVLALGIALLSIFLSVVLIYCIMILRDINKATDAIKDSAERVQAMIIKPLKMTNELLKYARPVVDMVEDRLTQETPEKKASKKKSPKKK